MKKIFRNQYKNFNQWYLLLLLLLPASGCNKFLNEGIPTGLVAGADVYSTNTSTGAVLTGVFYQMVQAGYTAGNASLGYKSSMYTDDLLNFDPTNVGNQAIYTDNIQSSNVPFWGSLYAEIYSCNAALEGIASSTSPTLTNKNQYLGEAYFTRAFLYFYLVNMYGDVPLAITTDPKINDKLSRTPQAQVYAQIISDLKNAKTLLPANYQDPNGTVTTSRSRPNQAAASALLARVYLYQGDWTDAESEATAVIVNSSFKLVSPSQTFLTGNQEVIWGLTPPSPFIVSDYSGYNNGEPTVIPAGKTYQTYGTSGAATNDLIAAFETNDARLTNWLRLVSDPANNRSFYFPNKYKSSVSGVEILVALRLAEQYLIRAEARAMQNNFTGAQADLNAVRTRAGLGATAATTQSTLVNAILKERRTEFFTEWGMRFFDLKRLGRIDQVMNAIAPAKGATWASYKQLWPITASEIIANPNIKQNPGFLN